MTGDFPSQRASNAELFPFDDVIMGWCLVARDTHWLFCALQVFLCLLHGQRQEPIVTLSMTALLSVSQHVFNELS